jgi:transcriptional regulator with XRE-family HTH domain
MLSRVERGVASPSIDTLAKIAAALKMPVAALFDDDAAFWATLVRDVS